MSRGSMTRSVFVSTPPWNTSCLRRRLLNAVVGHAGRGRRDLAEEARLDAAGEREPDLGVAVEAAVDHVVVQPDVRIPVIHELREVREREALQRQARLHALAVVAR